MNKAVIILAHQLPEQLNIFINQLLVDEETTDIYIHVNKKNQDIIPQIKKNDRVFVSDNNIAINWGSDEILKALIIMLREILNSGRYYKYILLASGQDLLVRSGLDEYLETHDGQVFIDSWNSDLKSIDLFRRAMLLARWPSVLRRKFDFKFHPLRIIRSLRIRLFLIGFPILRKKVGFDVSSITFYQNYFWCALPYDVAQYILYYIDTTPEYWQIYENALIPEESFVSTIIMNSEYSKRIHFTNGKSCSLTYTDTVQNNHMPVIKISDIKSIDESNAFFARKFDYRIDKVVVDYFIQKTKSSKEI